MKYLFITFVLSAFLFGCSNLEDNSFEDMNIQATIDAGIKIALENITVTAKPIPTETPTQPTPMPPTLVPPTPMPPPPLPPTPTPTKTPTHQSQIIENELSNEELINKNIDLKLLALNLINADRLKAGLNKVKLGNNPAAQMHSEYAIKHEFVSHWMLNGEKPYHVYSREGGTSYVAENGFHDGWTKEEWKNENCDLLNCVVPNREYIVYEAQEGLMNSPGHKKNILNPTHLKVNIGIATNKEGRFYSFYQHFEGGHFSAVLDYKKDYLSVVIYNNSHEYTFGNSIEITQDPFPLNLEKDVIDVQKGGIIPYQYGGGYTDECTDECTVAYILQPPPPGTFYSDLSSKTVIASKWETVSSNPNLPSDKLTVQANLSNIKAIRNPGIYTVLFWGENVETTESHLLIGLSFYVD